jgi:small conductance mechanosensitive channel
MFLFASNGLNIALTLVLLLAFIGLAYLVNKFVNKDPEAVKKGFIWYYLFLFVILVLFVGISLWFFNMDLLQILEDAGSGLLGLVQDSIGAIVGTVITIFLVIIIMKLVVIFVKRASQKEGPMQKRVITILKVVKSITRYVIYIIALIVILALWGVNVLPALAGLGILGLVIGMGAQSLIKDFISGFFIIFEHHFDVGDIVEINGFKGEVIDIGLKTTKLRNWKQDINITSNGSIGTLINFSKSPSVAVVKFGIGYGEDAQKTINLLNKELPKFREQYPEIIEDPVVLGVTELADSSVNMTVIIRCKTEQHYGVERAVRKGIKEILDKNGIEIPFPQMVMHKPEAK